MARASLAGAASRSAINLMLADHRAVEDLEALLIEQVGSVGVHAEVGIDETRPGEESG